jgi:hypothetical protein
MIHRVKFIKDMTQLFTNLLKVLMGKKTSLSTQKNIK